MNKSTPAWSVFARRIRVPLGFLLAALYLLLARPTWRSLVLGSIVVLPGLWIRALASGHVRKNEALATSGPYAYTRNPLYLGSLLIGVGFAMAARSWWIGLLLLVMFFAIYIPVIRGDRNFPNSMSTHGRCRGCFRDSDIPELGRDRARSPQTYTASTVNTMHFWAPSP